MTVKIVDLETTGTDPQNDKVVEIGAIDLDTNQEYNTFVNPGIDIPPEAISVHHILDSDVADAPSWPEAYKMVLGDDRIRIGHNGTNFDALFCEEDGDTWIDTLRLAKHAYNFGMFNLQFLRYKLQLNTGIKGGAHRALDDVKVCKALYERLQEDMGLTPEEMLAKQKEPVWQKQCQWGKKYKGIDWDKVPSDYLLWAVNNADYLDSDTRHNMVERLKGYGMEGKIK